MPLQTTTHKIGLLKLRRIVSDKDKYPQLSIEESGVKNKQYIYPSLLINFKSQPEIFSHRHVHVYFDENDGNLKYHFKNNNGQYLHINNGQFMVGAAIIPTNFNPIDFIIDILKKARRIEEGVNVNNPDKRYDI